MENRLSQALAIVAEWINAPARTAGQARQNQKSDAP
jgi:hypothetical protein